ncbi:hypothetical protein PR202_gb07427 [Eleusine coracana subsp. coracana]|uniref:Uncharacterized protein n=1 Tax=Eleusine coracana subsp. coracana TaxID=191504 RepID=A0AAV5E9P3_ELECO|nr:hypothetical protein PR202_gb07427 [Eleusine coracana subsp. coracana]
MIANLYQEEQRFVVEANCNSGGGADSCRGGVAAAKTQAVLGRRTGAGQMRAGISPGMSLPPPPPQTNFLFYRSELRRGS